MVFTLADNMRGFFVTRPPLVVFMICLASFAIALITFAYIVKSRDMPNPDITEDWNTFLRPLSSLEYCMISEPGAYISNASQEASSLEQGLKERMNQLSSQILSTSDAKKEKSVDGNDKAEGGGGAGGLQTASPTMSTTSAGGCQAQPLMNVSVLVDLELIATTSLQRIAVRHNFTFINATLSGQRLGLTGERSELKANLLVVLPSLGNQSHQCQHGQCYKVKGACVTFTASRCFFPSISLPDMNEQCLREEEGSRGEMENHFHMEVTPKGYIQCINASILTLSHPYDPKLTVMLTMEDRSIINLHLMHTSYFLFVMIVTLLCYALIKGRATKIRVDYTQCPTESSEASNHST